MRWTDSTLGATVEPSGLIQTGPFGSQLHQSDYVSDGIPVIMPKDIADGRVDAGTVARVSEETAMRLRRHQLRPRSLVLPRRGEITKRAWIGNEQAGWLCGTGCLQIVVEGTNLVPEFLYYYMEQEHVVRWLEQHAVGTTMLNLSASIVAQLPVRYPAPDVQSRIASILSAYDDLIENNNRRIALLEQAARLLYEEWFVRLRFPGREHTRIVDGVPKGWRVTSMSDVCEAVGGGTPSTKVPGYWDGDITWVVPTDVTRNDCLFLMNSARKITDTGLRESAATVVPAETILMTSRASVGFFALVDKPVCTNQGFINAIPKTQAIRMYLLHNLINRVEEIRSNAKGSTYPEISRGRFRDMPILVPPVALLEAFSGFAGTAHGMVMRLKRQKESARAARDLLLPRLMSGGLMV